MKLSSVVSTLACLPGLAEAWSLRRSPEHKWKWSPPGPDDVRAPCPMLNTLANHGYLPHSGKDITMDDTKSALFEALNINKTLAAFLHNFAITTNPTPNATTFSLDNLSRHNILEHDASLSRADFYWGDNHSFNKTVFAETRSYWTGPILDVQMAANARQARFATSKKTNPTFAMSDLGDQFSLGESAAYLLLLGNKDKDAGTAERAVVEYLFENERLPFKLGWKKSAELVNQDDLFNMMDRVYNASGAPPEAAGAMRKRSSFHVGIV